MVKLVYLLGLVATLATSTSGVLVRDADAHTLARRALIKSRRGLQVEDKWIAIVEDDDQDGVACNTVKKMIQDWKRENETNTYGRSTEEDDGEMGVSTAKVTTTCNVLFDAPDEELVEFVRNMSGVKVETDNEVTTDGAPNSWGLDRIDQESLPLSKSTFQRAYTGKGVNIYVIDTGINYAHNDFGGRASLAKDFTSEDGTGISDGNGHGTHCSGTAAGGSYGIASEANIMGVKVLLSSGSGSTSNVISGVAWAVQNQIDNYNGEPAVLSLSLGGGKSSAMNNVVKEAVEAGMIVVVAAGNEAQDACKTSPASAGGKARSGGVFTVGATTKTDSVAGYSNYGSCVDIFAPGSSITSTYKGSKTATATMSGTSMATPHVAGVAAILLEKHSMDRDSAQSELISLMVADKLSSIDEDSPNVLLQVPLYTGPPTPPTASPTMPPTLAPDTVCAWDGSDSTCIDFAQSNFGADFSNTVLYQGPLVAVTDTLCDATDDDFTGKVVLVPRGDCLFFDKVKVAEDQGAVAVMISLVDPDEEIFSPTYYGNENVGILSVMISYDDGQTFKNMIKYSSYEVTATLGSLSLGGTSAPTPYPTTKSPTLPTPQPTKAPTPMPTAKPTVSCSSLKKKNKCKKQSNCLWDTSSNGCYDVSDGDIPCSLLDEALCLTNDACSWAYLPSQSKKEACYDVDEIDSIADVEVISPDSCPETDKTNAEDICDELGLRLCTSDEAILGITNNGCKFDNQFVWTSDSCGKNKFYQARYATNSTRCRKYSGNGAVRCC